MPILSKKESDRGTITAVLLRAAHRRVPRLQLIKASVDGGARLTDWQIAFLNKVSHDAQEMTPFLADHPELHDTVVKAVALYHDITAQALRNEKANLATKTPPIELPEV